MIDIHNHILIDLDDGPKTEDEAIALIKQAINQGITDVIATPHHHSGSWKNPREVVETRVDELQSLIIKHDLALNIHSGQEIRINGDLLKELKKKESMSLNNSQYILIEFPFGEVPLYADQIFFELQMKGYVPLIAHPERCIPLLRNPNKLYDLVEKGAISQITASSINGSHGDNVRRKSMQFIESNLAHVIASDAHSVKYRPFELNDAYKTISDELGEDFVKLLKSNAKNILFNKEIPYRQPSRIKFEVKHDKHKKRRKKILGLF